MPPPASIDTGTAFSFQTDVRCCFTSCQFWFGDGEVDGGIGFPHDIRGLQTATVADVGALLRVSSTDI